MKQPTVIKISGDYAEVEEILKYVISRYDATTSLIKSNDKGGYHVYVNVLGRK